MRSREPRAVHEHDPEISPHAHIAGSGIQSGDVDLAVVPYSALAGRHLVVEEKMDGANCAIRFAPDGALLLQSRGHYLAGGPRERQFDLLKAWAGRRAPALWDVLGDRYVLYGEWVYARHTIYYTALPALLPRVRRARHLDRHLPLHASPARSTRRRALRRLRPCAPCGTSRHARRPARLHRAVDVHRRGPPGPTPRRRASSAAWTPTSPCARPTRQP